MSKAREQGATGACKLTEGEAEREMKRDGGEGEEKKD